MNFCVLCLVLCVATHIIRTTYELLKIRNRINPENKLVFAVLFSNMLLLWISWFSLNIADPVKLAFGPVVKYAGVAVLVCGTLFFILSLVKLKRFENYHGDLVTSGIFRYLRHPMYLGFILWMAGSALFFQSRSGCILAVVFTVNILIWKKLEEVQLMKVYTDYREYMKTTYF